MDSQLLSHPHGSVALTERPSEGVIGPRRAVVAGQGNDARGGGRQHVGAVVVPVGGEICEEVHDADQLLVFVEGEGEAVLDGVTGPFEANQLVSCGPAPGTTSAPALG
jgi:mannose-6-phosphate isomerase-like protein (cupin superfamily)